MKPIIFKKIISSILFLFVFGTLFGNELFNTSYYSPNLKKIKIYNPLGEINITTSINDSLTINAAAPDSISADSVSLYQPSDISVQTNMNTIEVESRYENFYAQLPIVWNIYLPENIYLCDIIQEKGNLKINQNKKLIGRITNNDGNIFITKSRGDLDMKNMHGNVSIDTYKGIADVNNLNGDIVLTNIRGKGSIRNFTGYITADSLIGKWDIYSTNSNMLAENSFGFLYVHKTNCTVQLFNNKFDIKGHLISAASYIRNNKGNINLNLLNGKILLEGNFEKYNKNLSSNHNTIKYNGKEYKNSYKNFKKDRKMILKLSATNAEIEVVNNEEN